MSKRRKTLRRKSFNKRSLLKYFLLLTVLAVSALFFYLSPKYGADKNLSPASLFPFEIKGDGIEDDRKDWIKTYFPGMVEGEYAWVTAKRISTDKYINKYEITEIKTTSQKKADSGTWNLDFKNISNNRWWIVVNGTYLQGKECKVVSGETALYRWDLKWDTDHALYSNKVDNKCTNKIPGSDGNVPSTPAPAAPADTPDTPGTAPAAPADTPGTTPALDHATVSPDSAPTFALGGTASEKVADKIEVGLNPDGTTGGSYSWKDYIIAFYYYAVRLGAVVVVLMIVYAGYTYITSNGDSAKLGNAKERIFGAIIGYLLLLLVGLILQYLGLS